MTDKRRHDVNETADQREERESDDKKQSYARVAVAERDQRGRWRRDLIIVASMLIALFGGERLIDKSNRASNIDIVLDAIEENCEDDRELRRQYRFRGIAEEKLLTLFLTMAEQNVKEGAPDAGASRSFIREFGPLIERIDTLPVPDCDQTRADIEDRIGR